MVRTLLLFLVAACVCAQDLESLRKAAEVRPSEVKAHLDLGLAYMKDWIPALSSPENAATGRLAEAEFKRALELDSTNRTALSCLGTLASQSALPLTVEEKSRKLDEAHDWYTRLTALDPTDKEAFYNLGANAWERSYPIAVAMTARLRLQTSAGDSDPLLDSQTRHELRTKYLATVEEGISSLEHALLLDPSNSSAMAYMSLLLRERANLGDTKEDYASDVAAADLWTAKAHAASPTRIRVGPEVQASNLITKVDPIYPNLEPRTHISGTVRFTAIIAKDGSVMNLQLVSGHPLLVRAALEAVKQYVYKPTVVNGAPVEVVTTIEVTFPLR